MMDTATLPDAIQDVPFDDWAADDDASQQSASNGAGPSSTNQSTALSQPIALAKSWADFDAEQYTQGERIAFAVERGEVALVNSLPNAGKTTLALNLSLSLTAGRAFGLIATETKARRVLYVDGETRRVRLQRDLRQMARDFSRDEVMAVGRNLHLICEGEVVGESLSLTKKDHFQRFSQEAVKLKPDFIVIDTLASLCPVFNENDNAEQQRSVWRPLQKLARDCDAAILVLHHVGKRSEDSQSPERVYRGRGASASGAFARAVWILTPDPVMPGLVTLSCAKAKGNTPPDSRFQLDSNTRWFQEVAPAPATKSTTEIVADAVTHRMTLADIKQVLAKHGFSDKTIRDSLNKAVASDLIEKVKQGVYRPRTAETADLLNAEPAEDAE